MSKPLRLTLVHDPLCVIRYPTLQSYLKHASGLLEHCTDQSFFSVTVTPTETSAIMPASFANPIMDPTVQIEDGWMTIRVEGPLDFSLIGILSKLATTLAEASVSIFVVSTFDTDYLLIKTEHLNTAKTALAQAGHTILDPSPPAPEATNTTTSTSTSTTPPTPDVAGFSPFALERYFAKHEFSAPYLLCCSDVQPLTQSELLAMADDECKELWDTLSLGYTESQGLPLLRQEIATPHTETTMDDVLVVAPEEGIYLFARALLKKGDVVVVPWPCYQSLSEIAEAIGCIVLRWVPKEDQHGALSFDIATLIELIHHNHPTLVVLNFPHNPTGLTITNEEMATVVQTCQQQQEQECWLFCDEMYRGLEQDPATRLVSAIDFGYERTAILAGMSKLYGLPGLRIGWVITKNTALMQRMGHLRDYTTICCSAPSEILSLIGLRNHAALTARSMSIVNTGLMAVNAFMSEHQDLFAWHPPTAGSISFPKLKISAKATAFCDAIVDKVGVMLLPSSVYGLDGDDRVRLGFGRSNCLECLTVLRKEVRSVVEALVKKE